MKLRPSICLILPLVGLITVIWSVSQFYYGIVWIGNSRSVLGVFFEKGRTGLYLATGPARAPIGGFIDPLYDGEPWLIPSDVAREFVGFGYMRYFEPSGSWTAAIYIPFWFICCMLALVWLLLRHRWVRRVG